MSSYGTSPIWCLCEKLPRSILHIVPTPDYWCVVCGGRRRPRACFSSSSDEEDREEERRQSLLAAQKQRQEEALRKEEALRQEEASRKEEALRQEEASRQEEEALRQEEASRQEEEASRQGSVRVKVAMTAMKPKSRRKSNCFKCGGKKRPSTNSGLQQQGNTKPNYNQNHYNYKLYMGRLGHFRKPRRLQSKLRDEKNSVESEQLQDVEPMPTAPPPPEPTPPSVGPAYVESFWERSQDVPNIVAIAHEVCNRPLHLRQRQSNYCNNLFVNDLIPLDKPITDPAGGAISKHRRLFGRPMRSHYSRPRPPLSQLLSDTPNKQQARAMGGGLSQKQDDTNCSQFAPFDYYDGPSEDALVEEAARQVLSQPKALHIGERTDLPTTRLCSFDSESSSDCSSSAPFEMPTAPPAERPRVGAPLRLHKMMKAVARSGLSESSASSSSSASSHKSVSSTLPVRQQSMRSCGGEELSYELKPIESVLVPTSHLEPISIMEKLRWLMEQKPPAELDPVEVENPDEHTGSVDVLLQLMDGLQLDGENCEEKHSTLLENNIENNFGSTAETTLTEAQHSNDMSNVLPLNSSNKSADAKYIDGIYYSEVDGQGPKIGDKGANRSSSTSMFSFISGLFPLRRSKGEVSLATDELKPLKLSQQLKYGSASRHQKRELTHSCRGKKLVDRNNASNSSCKKCGLSRKVSGENGPFHSSTFTRSSSYHTAKTPHNISSDNSEKLLRPRENFLIISEDSRNDNCGKISKTEANGKKLTQGISNIMDSQRKPTETFKKPQDRKIKDSTKLQSKPKEPSIISQNLKHFNNCQGKFIEAMKKTSNLKATNPKDKKVNTVLKESSTSSKVPKAPPILSQNLKHFNKCQGKLIEDNKVKTVFEESSTSCTVWEIVRKLADDACPGLQLKKVLENPRHRQPRTFHTLRTIQTVRFECNQIFRPKMVSSIRELGQLKEFTPKPLGFNKPFGLFEFRTPDVEKVESNEMSISEIDISELSEESLDSEAKKPALKKHQHAVWPAHSLRHRKRQIKYTAIQMELSYTVNDKSQEEVSTLRKQKKSGKNERWLANEVVKKKIQAMMMKPIKLLSFNETTAVESQ